MARKPKQAPSPTPDRPVVAPDLAAQAIENLRTMALMEVKRLGDKVQAGVTLSTSERSSLFRLRKAFETGSSSPKRPETVAFSPRSVTVSLAADCFGLDRRSLQYWFKEGAPKNADGTVSLPDLFRWCGERAKSDRDTTQSITNWDRIFRKWKARAAELAYRRARGELITQDEVASTVGSIAATVSGALSRLPAQIAQTLEHRHRADIEARLAVEIDDILSHLAQCEYVQKQSRVEGRGSRPSSPNPTASSRPGGPASGRGRKRRVPSGPSST